MDMLTMMIDGFDDDDEPFTMHGDDEDGGDGGDKR